MARGKAVALAAGVLLPLCVGLGGALCMTKMPGESHRGALPALTTELAALASRLESHVVELATRIGERNVLVAPEGLQAAQRYIAAQLSAACNGSCAVRLEDLGAAGRHAQNLVVEVSPRADAKDTRRRPIIVVGAHYDTNVGTPGANDNGSGVAAALELFERFAARPGAVGFRFVFFANEEAPFFQGPGMGSLVHAQRAKKRGDDIAAMLSLETLGHYSDEAGSQRYPEPLDRVYPSVGNFIAFVGNPASSELTRALVKGFRDKAAFPSEGGVLPESLPGVGWSDHWSFWQTGYQAVMVTDTALFRDPHYHRATDVPAHLDFAKLARVVAGLEATLRQHATSLVRRK